MVSRHLAKFNDHRHRGNGDIMVLVCHVILQEQMMKGLYDFIGGSPLQPCQVWWPWALCVHVFVSRPLLFPYRWVGRGL